MSRHISSALMLLVLTVVICCILYPLTLLGIGAAFFPAQAQGSIVLGADGKPVGSHLIAQGFASDEYFWPRPSAVAYNGAGSGGSNWAAANYRLRDRVARALGPIVRYRSGALVGPDVEKWFQGTPGVVAQWAQAHPALAQDWVKADPLHSDYVAVWQRETAQEGAPADVAVPFFQSFAKTHPGKFPVVVEEKASDGATTKRVTLTGTGTEVQAIFFDLWRQAHPDADLEPVPADLVTASGSGLDPHITMKNALYQLDRVAGTWAAKTKRNRGEVRKEIEKLLEQHRQTVFTGPPLVNVLEVNASLQKQFGDKQIPKTR